MINPQGTSFIPQRPTKGKVNPRRVRKIYILTYLSYVFFFGAILSAAGVFFLNLSVDLQLERQKELLAAERSKFNQSAIESTRDLEKRITIAQERLNNHISVLAILEALEQSAVQTLQFVGFTYERINDEFPLVTFSGDANTFDSIIFQRDVLEGNPILAGSTFKEVGMSSATSETNPSNVQKIVTFTLEKEIDTGLIGYTPRETADPVQTSEPVVIEEQEEPVQDDSDDSDVSDTPDQEEESEPAEDTNEIQ